MFKRERTYRMRSFIRPLFPVVAALTAVAATPAISHAHFVWAIVENGQVRFALQENVAEAPSAKFAQYVAALAPRAGGKTLTLGVPKDGARYAALPRGQGVATAESIVGVKERNGETYLLAYHPKGAATLKAASEITKVPAELTARQEGDTLIVSVRQEGWPVPQSEVWVQWPGDETPSSSTTDVKGEVRVPWPAENARRGGHVGLRVLVKEVTAGENGGKKYTQIHRWATLTFPVAGPKATAPNPVATAATASIAAVQVSGEKPFTQILRASYAGNHEVVGNAAFNKTLFAGALTKPQLEVHLQQRALVHNEVHRILNAAEPAKAVPYGAAQRQVLVYLFQDLIALGSGWPTEAQARPLTKAFLQEIRDSEKLGPFFALGVQHIYYGGITNGGRMIGEEIGKTLKVTPSYYAKSDGYTEYLAQVNKIADPDARAEMIRGGQAAYRYIIASSNEDVFKTKDAAGETHN